VAASPDPILRVDFALSEALFATPARFADGKDDSQLEAIELLKSSRRRERRLAVQVP
jgi:hypothetical protein